MPVVGSFNPPLNDTALGYLALGWSVIPLYGDADPDRPKVAALAWEPFQRRRAREAEVTAWFTRPDIGALGIVTGAVSQLVLLDFDDLRLLQAFERLCPELMATRNVLTRRGRHLYFHLPPQLVVRSRKLDGLDLLAGGRYAVAPPSVIDGHPYTLGQGGRPRTLTQRDLDRIEAFLDQRTADRPTVTSARPPTQEPTAATPGPAPSDSTPLNLSAERLVGLYQALAQQTKRNVALFKTSCLARDHGWSYAAVIETLADVHATQPARDPHRPEKEKSRYREALATIRSVFSRPARRLKQPDIGGLYNSLREQFFRLGQTCVVRVLEGLRLAGLQAGQLVTESEIVHVLHGLVGRRSIRAALQALSPQNRLIFEKISPRYPPPRSAAAEMRIVNTNNAPVSSSKRDKTGGRPSTHFRIPTLDRLCRLLSVKPSASDPLTLEDLQSARKTRQAAHRELIRRRPGLYLRQWLADRLGVSGPTLWRYSEALDGLCVTPTYTATTLGWHNLSAIPAEALHATGTCLEDDTGKRWPALKGIATRLLGQGRAVRLLVQSLSYYAFGPVEPAGMTVERSIDRPKLHREEPLLTLAQRVERLIRVVEIRPEPSASAVPRTQSLPFPDPPARDHGLNAYAKPVKKRRRHGWKPLDRPDDEALAQQVYSVVNARTADPRRKLSLTSARTLVDRYGAALVTQGLASLQRRHGVQQPAGWLSTWLRSQARSALDRPILGV